jgi:aminopeptidase YwaD
MRRLLLFLLAIATLTVTAQNKNAARKIVSTLSAADFWGRGYTKGGMGKAADYISKQFKSLGLQPMAGKDFRQPFNYPVNTFPGKMSLLVNGKSLSPGKDFIVVPGSTGLKATAIHPVQADSVTYVAQKQRLMLVVQDKLTWGVAKKEEDYTAIQLSRKAIVGKPETISLDIENLFVPDFETNNICGIVKGTKYPDSILLITAHYDHLGGMGANTYFPGANDNASGIALVLSLAKYYAANPAPYSIGFICFAGEEAGLLGSAYFTQHPLLPLQHIKFMLNLDMVGTGESGITVVNATLHPQAFKKLNVINDQYHFLHKINPRGMAANSDHYHFTEKNVPAFFIYTQGGIAAYHDVFDSATTLPLTEFSDLYHLIIKFNSALMQ